MPQFLINRPVFAWVIAIVIMLAGAISAFTLPVEQYPTIAPPSVTVSTFYPGADAATLQNSVTQIIEQQLTGLDHLLYFSSASNADGSVSITATFFAPAQATNACFPSGAKRIPDGPSDIDTDLMISFVAAS